MILWCGFVGIWNVIDIFIIPSMVKGYNLKLAYTLNLESIPTREMLAITQKILGNAPAARSAAELAGRQEVHALAPYGREYRDEITGMEFVWVPPGSFDMGDVLGDEEYSSERPVHRVRLQGFYLGKYAVTQGEWQKIMGNNLSRFQKGDRYPVENVSWNDVQEFIQKLNRKSGKAYSLPSEAQWEYAAREGGKKVRFGNGKDVIDPDEANFNCKESYKKRYSRTGVYRGETVPVDCFSPNGLGLYNMSGNVWEWCQDRWHDNYDGAPTDGSAWESGYDLYHVVRGGSWFDDPDGLCAAYRDRIWAVDGAGYVGFRLSLPVQQG